MFPHLESEQVCTKLIAHTTEVLSAYVILFATMKSRGKHARNVTQVYLDLVAYNEQEPSIYPQYQRYACQFRAMLLM